MEGDELVHKESIFEDQDDSTSTPELVLADDSAFSSDEATEPAMPPPKKSRRGDKKKVELVPIGGDGSPRSKMEVYPPPDSWSWRKYGQKPIKGSPYPRGYYRCSSSKGCPARKQVERSRVDPSMLQITYSHEHNHPIPTTTHKHHRQPTTRAPPPVESSPSTSSTSTATTDTAEESVKVEHSPEEDMTNQLDQEPDNIGFYEFTTDLEWFSNMGSTAMLNSPTFVGPKWVDADVTLMLPIGEEDQSLFGDLGELPECSVVFQRRCVGEQPACIASG